MTDTEEDAESQAFNHRELKGSYDHVVVGGGAAGSVVAGELSKTGAEVLVVEAGGLDAADCRRPR